MIQAQLKLRLNSKRENTLTGWLWNLTGVWNWAIRKIGLDAKDQIYHGAKDFQNLLANHGEKMGIPSHTLQGVFEFWRTPGKSWRAVDARLFVVPPAGRVAPASRCTLAKSKLELALPELHPLVTASLEKEWALLCACATPLSTQKRIRSLLATAIDWDLLLELADEHRVQGVLAKRLEEANFGSVPAHAREKLQTRMRAQHLFTLSMTAELFRILKEFSEARIDSLLVKGPVISSLAYGDPAMRSYVDLDLLLRHRDVQVATRRMLAMGFDPDVPESAILAGKIPGEYLFYRPGTQRMVELHTERTFRYYPKPMRCEELFARKQMVLLDGREVPALSLEDELVLNCIHGAKHFWERLMWVADVAAVVTRHPEIDWNKVRSAAAEVGAERMLRVGILMGALQFGIELPAAIANEIREDRTSERLCRQITKWLPYAGYAPPALRQRAFYRISMAGGGITGAAYLARLSLSPTEEDWKEGAEERRSWLWDAVRRPFRLLRKYGSGE